MHWPRHTAKIEPLPCARPMGHTAKGSATSSCHPSMKDWRGSARAHGKAFAVCPTYSTRQSGPLPTTVCRVPFAVCGTRQTLCRGYFGVYRVFRAHGKVPASRSAPVVSRGLKLGWVDLTTRIFTSHTQFANFHSHFLKFPSKAWNHLFHSIVCCKCYINSYPLCLEIINSCLR